MLVFVNAGLNRFQFLGAQLLEQFRLALEQGVVHGALGHIKQEACIRDPRIGQRGLQLLERLLCFGTLADGAEHLRQLAFGALDQDVGDDVDQGQTVALRQASNRFLLDLAKATLCTLDLVHGPASSFDAGQACSSQGQTHEGSGRQELFIQVLVWIGLVHVLFDGLAQALVACTESNVGGSSGHRILLCVLHSGVGNRLERSCTGLSRFDHRSGLGSVGQNAGERQRAANTFAHCAGIALSSIDRGAFASVEELGQRGHLVLLHAQALANFLGCKVRQCEQSAVESPGEVVDQALRCLAVRGRHLKARGPRIDRPGPCLCRSAFCATDNLAGCHVNNFSTGIGQRRHYWFRARS